MENIISATEQVASKVGSDNIQSINIKTSDSIALPILNCLPPGPTVIDITSQSTASKRRLEDDDPASNVEPEEVQPVKKRVKKAPAYKLSNKRVRGSVVVKKQSIRRKQKR